MEFSVNPAQKDVVIEYIKKQEEHHKTKSFQDEFRAFLKKYHVEYDERYSFWDWLCPYRAMSGWDGFCPQGYALCWVLGPFRAREDYEIIFVTSGRTKLIEIGKIKALKVRQIQHRATSYDKMKGRKKIIVPGDKVPNL